MDRNLTLSMRLAADASRWTQGLGTADRSTRGFVQGVQRQMQSLQRIMQSTAAQIGVSVGAGMALRDAAGLDKQLIRIAQTAGEPISRVQALRAELFSLAEASGQPLDSLRDGFGSVIQAGEGWQSSLEVIRAINPAMAVTGSRAEVLAAALGSAKANFGFDLTQPGVAVRLLDQMTLAGRQGNAELENLSDIFARVGLNAKTANFSFEQTLSFIEGLSLIERQPERLATLADSTIRLFGNADYLKAAAAATGVDFFDGAGARRDPISVLEDIRTTYASLVSDADRLSFIDAAFGTTDLDTKRGLMALLSGQMLESIRSMTAEQAGASGLVARDFPAATRNAEDQAKRLSATVRRLTDSVVQPLNNLFAEQVQRRTMPVSEGGDGWSNKQMLGVLAAGAVGMRIGGALLGSVVANAGNLASGLATGNTVQQLTNNQVAQVFVVNWPAAMGGGDGGLLGTGIVGSLGVLAVGQIAKALSGSAGVAGRIAGGFAGIASGVAQGKALQSLAGVQPVFVVNWPEKMGGDGGAVGAVGAVGRLAQGAALAGAGAVGYGAGTLFYHAIDNKDWFINGTDFLGRSIDRLASMLGSDSAKQRLELDLAVRADGFTTVTPRASSSAAAVDFDVRQAIRSGTRGAIP